jgi:PAS domain S-box-containing protein
MKDFETSKGIGFDALFNSASIGIIITDENSRIMQANPFLLHLFGYNLAEVTSQPIELLMPARFREVHVDHRNDYQHHPRRRVMGDGLTLLGLRRDGTEFPIEVSLGPYKSADRQYVIAFISDISNRKAAENELKQLNAELEAKVSERTASLNRIVLQLEAHMKEIEEKDKELQIALQKERELNDMKSKFVSLASHEFRTPLSAILTSTFLISKYAESGNIDQQEKHLKKISRSVSLLTDILNDFLSVSKIEEGKVELRYTLFDIHRFMGIIVEEMNMVLKQRQEIAFTHHGSHEILLEPSLIRHIITNLLSNAIKFSPEGNTILLNTRFENGTLTIQVKDHGMGIPAEDQPLLFQRFFRAGNVSYVQGTGLGLHIIGKYVELMDGTITCESELNKGTTFTVVFNQVVSVVDDNQQVR